MDNEESSAQKRLLAGSVWSNTARVADAAVAGGAVAGVVVRGGGWGCSGECGREGSGNDMDGNEDVGDEGRCSQFGESDGSPVAAVCAPADGAERDGGGTFELVDRGGFCYVMYTHACHGRQLKKKKRCGRGGARAGEK